MSRTTRAWALGLGLAIVATTTGCRSRDLRVPPVPRYSDDPTVAPGPQALIDPAASDPYGGLNPYANANLGRTAPDPAAAAMTAAPPAADPFAGINSTPPAVAEAPVPVVEAAPPDYPIPVTNPVVEPAPLGDPAAVPAALPSPGDPAAGIPPMPPPELPAP